MPTSKHEAVKDKKMMLELIEELKKTMGAPRKFNDPSEIFNRGIEYIEKCVKNEEPLTITGLVIYLGTTKETLLDYQSGKYNTENKNFSDPIKRLKFMVENGYELGLHRNNPTGAIFGLKNFGWKDTQEIVNRTTKVDDLNPDEIEELKKQLSST